MLKTEFARIYQKLCAWYPGKMSTDTFALDSWYELLQDLPADLVMAGSLEYASTGTPFPPSAGQLRQASLKLRKIAAGIPSAAAAWQEILESPPGGIVKQSAPNEDPETMADRPWVIYTASYKFSHPVVEKVARQLGWPSLFPGDHLAADRARFMDAYTMEIATQTDDAARLPVVNKYLDKITPNQPKQIGEITKKWSQENE